MLHITDVRETMPDGAAVWTLKLEGDIQGSWVNELRRAWRAVRMAASGASIRLVLADVGSSIPPGRPCSERCMAMASISSRPAPAAAIRDEIVEGSASPDPGSTT